MPSLSVTSRKVEESLVLAPEAEQVLFVNRHYCDLIVYYDQSSTTIPTSYNEPLRNLKVAIYENEFSKTLQRVPVLLTGGFDAWAQQIGDRGIYVFPSATQVRPAHSGSENQENIPPPRLNGSAAAQGRLPWLKDVVGRTEDVQMGDDGDLNRTVMDYVRAKWSGGDGRYVLLFLTLSLLSVQ